MAATPHTLGAAASGRKRPPIEERITQDEGRPSLDPPDPPDVDLEDTAAGRLALRFARWLESKRPRTRRQKVLAYGAMFLVLVVPSVALLAGVILVGRRQTESEFAALGYAGVFLSNFLSTATVFVPVPVMLAVGQALIVSQASASSPLAAGLIGGLGMGLGEVSAYFTGFAGSVVAEETDLKGPRWLQPALDRLIRAVNWLMTRYGVPTLFVLAVIPDPVFEFAGITAGAMRMGFRKFMVVVVSGNIVRGLLLAYLGKELLEI